MNDDRMAAMLPEDASVSQADLAYRRLEEAIVTLRLEPGSLLTEAQAVELAELGRTPVREALLRLAQQGLIGILPRKGLTIRPVDPLDLLSVLEVRDVLEHTVISAAAVRASSLERRKILGFAQDMQLAADEGDVVSYMRLDKLLDEAIGVSARNAYAVRALESLQTLMRRAWYAFGRAHDLTAAADLHLAIAQAIAVADVPAAGTASDALIEHMRVGLRQQIRAD